MEKKLTLKLNKQPEAPESQPTVQPTQTQQSQPQPTATQQVFTHESNPRLKRDFGDMLPFIKIQNHLSSSCPNITDLYKFVNNDKTQSDLIVFKANSSHFKPNELGLLIKPNMKSSSGKQFIDWFPSDSISRQNVFLANSVEELKDIEHAKKVRPSISNALYDPNGFSSSFTCVVYSNLGIDSHNITRELERGDGDYRKTFKYLEEGITKIQQLLQENSNSLKTYVKKNIGSDLTYIIIPTNDGNIRNKYKILITPITPGVNKMPNIVQSAKPEYMVLTVYKPGMDIKRDAVDFSKFFIAQKTVDGVKQPLDENNFNALKNTVNLVSQDRERKDEYIGKSIDLFVKVSDSLEYSSLYNTFIMDYINSEIFLPKGTTYVPVFVGE